VYRPPAIDNPQSPSFVQGMISAFQLPTSRSGSPNHQFAIVESFHPGGVGPPRLSAEAPSDRNPVVVASETRGKRRCGSLWQNNLVSRSRGGGSYRHRRIWCFVARSFARSGMSIQREESVASSKLSNMLCCHWMTASPNVSFPISLAAADQGATNCCSAEWDVLPKARLSTSRTSRTP
jgi:hypothetical protein